MPHASYRAVARAAAVVAVSVAIPVATVRAQPFPILTKPAALALAHACNNSPAAASSASALYAKCVVNFLDPYSGDLGTGTATARVTPGVGGSVHLSTSFTGKPVSGMYTSGAYPESFRIDPLPGFSMDDIANIFLSSNVTFMAASDAPPDYQYFYQYFSNWAFLEAWGSQEDDYQQAGFSLDFRYDDPFGTQNVALQISMSPGSSNTFFYQMTATSSNNPGSSALDLNVQTSTDVLFRAPDVTLFNADGTDITPRYTLTFDPPVAAIPEPASVILTLTGLANLAGFARRRRRRYFPR